MPRLNNLSARLAINEWLEATGRAPLSSDLSYEEFATQLRRIRAAKMVQIPFRSREDAVAYIRDSAREALKAKRPEE